VSESEGKIKKTNGKDNIELIEHILSQYGLKLDKGEIGTPAKINKGGFPLANHSAYEAIHYLTRMTGVPD